jgi:Arc/MetJ-type ribon-helix-helix transcriptional regulator
MKKDKAISPSLKYFFKHLERRSEQIREEVEAYQIAHHEVPFDEVESFFRRIMTQNIFIFTVGLSGRPESTILNKAVFNMNRVVRLYYSTSFDDNESGYIRIRPDNALQLIVVERVHGIRPVPEVMYQSHDECHVVRFIVRWLLRRIDWKKTHLRNLDLYKAYIDQERQEQQAKEAAEEARRIEEQMAHAMKKLKGKI